MTKRLRNNEKQKERRVANVVPEVTRVATVW
jgi:hypothetical protein